LILGKRKTTAEFILDAKKVHGDLYDYSKVEYLNTNTKVTIVCKIHGGFQKIPKEHLKGVGCQKCSKIKSANNLKMSQDEFISKANKEHNFKYDYSKVVYLNTNTKVVIVCKIHGEFEQIPKMHVKGQGCPKCGVLKRNNSLRKTIEQFIEESHKKHNIINNIYDYSLVQYKTVMIKVKIICKKHGIFEQTPNSHLRGAGCPECSGNKRITSKAFIKKAKKNHENLYDYSNVEYVNNSTKVRIICKEHGVFEQRPSDHLNGIGCSKCSGKFHKTTEYFIEEAKKIHENLYDYSLVNYINSKSKILIICKEHGVFKQEPTSHLNKIGCPTCGGTKNKTQSEFIQEARHKHNNLYNYSLSIFHTMKHKVKIECKVHGIFEQIASNHLQGAGCPKCIGRNKTTLEIILEFQKVHKEIYDYSLVDYINSKSNIIIICRKHGKFKQNVGNHLQGAGCIKCAGVYRRTTKEFIEKANKKHNYKYDYFKVDYINSKKK